MTEGKAARKGFITIATGRDEYYVLAHNLLMSYRFHSRSSVPFGIICDKQNGFTADFDTVVLMEDPQFSVFDKLRLPELIPFDETIFIEADCLLYRDPNGMWGLFKDGPDFGALGNVRSLDDPEGWFRAEYLGPYRSRVKQQFQHQGGVYYMRKGPALDDFTRTCKEIRLHQDDFHFKLPNEEPVFALACMLHGFLPVADWIYVFCYYPAVTVTRIDIIRGIILFNTSFCFQSRPGLFLVHWGSDNTRKPLYLREAEAVTSRVRQGKHASAFNPVRIRINTVLLYIKEFIKPIVPLSVKQWIWRKHIAQ